MTNHASARKALRPTKTRDLPDIIEANRNLFTGYLSLLLIYSAFALVPTPQEQVLKRYQLSALDFRILELTIIIFLALIWGVGFYGYAKLKAYASLIDGQKDGKHVKTICHGIFLLSLWLPISESVSVILKYFSVRHTGLLPGFMIIDNYIGLILPLAAFIFIGKGARGLNGLVRHRISFTVSTLILLTVVYVGLIYAHLAIAAPYRNVAYQMSIWAVLMTIIAPYMFMWFTGAIAAVELYNYQRKVSGILYKKSWSILALGTGWLILTSVAFQYLVTLSIRLQSLSIYWLLAIVYSLLGVLSAGFILIAMGTNKLQKIEEV